MADSTLRDIYGLSLTAANVRANNINLAYTQKGLCEALTLSFDLSLSQGDNAYSLFIKNSNVFGTLGFGVTSVYNSYESQVYTIINNQVPNLPDTKKKILSLGAHAFIFASAINGNIVISDIQSILTKILANISTIINKDSSFTTSSPNPFTEQILDSLLSNDYSSVVAAIASSPKDTETNLVNFNWYDTSSLFAGPNLQVMKDIENQYYYLSGQLLYSSIVGDLPNCITDTITINTPNGQKNTIYIRNTPCIDPDSYIGPINGIKFFRLFNDGPPSTGDFNSHVKTSYIEFDQNILSPNDYESNAKVLSSFMSDGAGGFLKLTNPKVFIDGYGQYNISGIEYENTPASYSSCPVYQNMHIGDNSPRIIRDTGCNIHNVTGFKFASLELDSNIWGNQYAYILSNPLSPNNRILKRALNIIPNPYIATDIGDGLETLTIDQFQNQFWYVGPPQLNSSSSLPNLAFYQTFDNPTFGKYSSIVLYPSIGFSSGDESQYSMRNFLLSNKPVASGQSNSHSTFDNPNISSVSFYNEIGSNLSGYDDIAKKFFGMGDNFDNNYSITDYAASNCDFPYTGYILSGVSGLINILNLTNLYTGYILGSSYKTIKYISGYNANSETIGISQMFAQYDKDQIIPYYYIDNRSVGSSSDFVQETQLPYFASVPSNLEVKYPRIYQTQEVENYLPRYSSGPYAVETRKFLYPQASLANKIYFGKLRGFPINVKFSVTVREEAVKEIFGTYQITPDRNITTIPTPIRIVRPSSNNTIDYTQIAPIMENIFYPDDQQYNFAYNFNNFKSSGFSYSAGIGLVDINYSPLINGYVASGRNNTVYNQTRNLKTDVFSNGIRMTGDGVQASLIITGTGAGQNIFLYSQSPHPVGLYHGYNISSFTGSMSYTLPVYSLSSGTLFVNDTIKTAFPTSETLAGISVDEYGKSQYFLDNGKDPLFYEYVGGRVGGLNAVAEGGYNSKGIIGDRWNTLLYNTLGSNVFFDTQCQQDYFCRTPEFDDTVLLFNATPTGTTIWTDGMAFTPFVVDRNINALGINNQFNYQYTGISGKLSASIISGEYLVFNLSNFFPPKLTTGQEWYYQGGLTIGPFDRDIELGMFAPHNLISYTDLYINNQKMSNLYSSQECNKDLLKGIGVDNSGIFLNEMGRNSNYTIIYVIKSGDSLNINVYSNPIIGGNSFIPSGYPAETLIGMPTGNVVTLKTYRPLDASLYDSRLQLGELGWLNSHLYINNGSQKSFFIEHDNGFSDLAGTFEYVVYSKTGKLYPIPNSDFTGFANPDRFGNLIYPSDFNVEQYWEIQARKNLTPITISGYREGSRLSFTISNVSLEFDEIPYQDYRLVIPSGNCVISGQMGYYAQADNTVFSEGVYLKDTTIGDPNKNLYNPSYLSTVLRRIPSIASLTGSVNSPILTAPSIMEQRANVSGIKVGQKYIYLLKSPPDNYNKLLWPTLSDLETLNPGETIEALPSDDGNTFTNNNLMFSASQGQQLPNGSKNPNVERKYDIQNQYQMYDSISTDAILNSGKCITSNRGHLVTLTQHKMSGILAPANTSLSFAIQGLT